jgi:hypothetical protein
MGIDVGKIDTYRLAEELYGPCEVTVTGPGAEASTRFRQGCLFSTRLRYVKESLASLCYRAANRH